MIQKQLLLPIGVVLFLIGIGLTFYNVTTEEWYIGEGTDLLDDKTWVIRDQSIGFAMPWSYDLGILPEGTRLWARFNVTTVETRVGVSRPGLSRHTITDFETGEVLLTTDAKPAFSQSFFTASSTSHYKYTVLSIKPSVYGTGGYEIDTTPIDFLACIQAYRLLPVYPYRLIGVPLLITGVALAAYTKVRK